MVCPDWQKIGELNGVPLYFEPGPPKSRREMMAEYEARKHQNPDSIVQNMKDYSTCDIADALVKLGHPHGGFLSGIAMYSPSHPSGPVRRIGPAYTVKYVSKSDAIAPKHEGHYIDALPPHSILFISAPSTPSALYGGLMSTRAKHLNAAAAIVDGRIRDLEEHRELDFPVFARGVGVAGPGSLLRVSEVDVHVQHQGEEGQVTTINPGDYLIADPNGVVCLPKALAEKVIRLVPSQVEADEKLREDLEGGRAFGEASRERRAGVLAMDDLDVEAERNEDGEEAGADKGKEEVKENAQAKGKGKKRKDWSANVKSEDDSLDRDGDSADERETTREKGDNSKRDGKERKDMSLDVENKDEEDATPPADPKSRRATRDSRGKAPEQPAAKGSTPNKRRKQSEGKAFR